MTDKTPDELEQMLKDFKVLAVPTSEKPKDVGLVLDTASEVNELLKLLGIDPSQAEVVAPEDLPPELRNKVNTGNRVVAAEVSGKDLLAALSKLKRLRTPEDLRGKGVAKELRELLESITGVTTEDARALVEARHIHANASDPTSVAALGLVAVEMGKIAEANDDPLTAFLKHNGIGEEWFEVRMKHLAAALVNALPPNITKELVKDPLSSEVIKSWVATIYVEAMLFGIYRGITPS